VSVARFLRAHRVFLSNSAQVLLFGTTPLLCFFFFACDSSAYPQPDPLAFPHLGSRARSTQFLTCSPCSYLGRSGFGFLRSGKLLLVSLPSPLKKWIVPYVSPIVYYPVSVCGTSGSYLRSFVAVFFELSHLPPISILWVADFVSPPCSFWQNSVFGVVYKNRFSLSFLSDALLRYTPLPSLPTLSVFYAGGPLLLYPFACHTPAPPPFPPRFV